MLLAIILAVFVILSAHSHLIPIFSGTYYPERCQKVPGVRVKHTMEAGNRYVVHFEKANRVAMEVQIGRNLLI